MCQRQGRRIGAASVAIWLSCSVTLMDLPRPCWPLSSLFELLPSDRPPDSGRSERSREEGQLLLRGLVPAIEALLQALCRLLRRLGAVDHVGRRRPGLVLEVGRA